MRHRIRAALAATAIAATSLLAPPAQAAPVPANTVSYRVLGYLWENSATNGWTGRHEAIQWQDLGPCDFAGYRMTLAAVPSNALHAGSVGLWQNALSAVMIHSSVNESCNYVIMYTVTGFFQNTLKICGQGYLSVRFVGAYCNDRVMRIDFVKR